jgi:hypothetical protein
MDKEMSLVCFSLLIRIQVLVDLSPTLLTSFNLNYLLKSTISKYTLAVGASICLGARPKFNSQEKV